MNGHRLLTIIAYTVLTTATVGFIIAHLKPSWWLPQRSVVIVERDREPPADSLAKDFRRAAQAGQRAVVALQPRGEEGGKENALLPPNHPPIPEEEDLEEREVGSGVIISADGLIVTNAHVVGEAEEALVRFADGTTLTARLVGIDRETDLALLQLAEADKIALAPLPFAPDDSYAVGDIVLAVGHPFGVGQTVTMGIISALNRTELGLSTFEQFIQTDAAINPGNSGGALIDTSGRLVGINTAIYSQTGGNLGIGFAIPVRTVRNVVAELVAQGRVRRGWLGVQLQPLDEGLAEALGVPGESAVAVVAVLPNTPAQQAGIRPGDLIVAVAGQPVRRVREVLDRVAANPPGTPVVLTIVRHGKRLQVTVVAGERPALTAPQ
jgi:S1-C subfamily serine protease